MWKSNRFDIVVVGGGPAGTTFARVAAAAGLSVLVLEKDRDIGMPVRCGEAVSEAGLRIFLEPQAHWIRATIDRIRLVAPNETVTEFNLQEHGYILDRRVFDYDLARLAAEEGAVIVTKAYVNGLLFDDGQVCGVKGVHLEQPFEIPARLVVAADGVESRVGRWAGIRTQCKLKDMESAIQKTVSGIDVDENVFEFYLAARWAPGGYLWVFPKGPHSANIGLGISGEYARRGRSALSYLDEFMDWKYPRAAVLTTVAGGVPVAKTLKRITAPGLMLVGDAAHTVNPLTGGGIIPALRSGQLAAETAVRVLARGQTPTRENLSAYEREWSRIGGKNHERFYRIKEAVFRFDDEDLNRIAAGIGVIPEKERTLFKLFSVAVRKKPSLLLDITRLFAGI